MIYDTKTNFLVRALSGVESMCSDNIPCGLVNLLCTLTVPMWIPIRVRPGALSCYSDQLNVTHCVFQSKQYVY